MTFVFVCASINDTKKGGIPMKEETINDLKELLILNSELFEVYQDLETLDMNNMRNTDDFRKKWQE